MLWAFNINECEERLELPLQVIVTLILIGLKHTGSTTAFSNNDGPAPILNKQQKNRLRLPRKESR